MYKVKVNNHQTFDIETRDNNLRVNGSAIHLDTVRLSQSQFHVIHNNRSYNIEIVDEDKAGKSMAIKVNGNLHQVLLEDQFDRLLKRLGLDNMSGAKVKDIKAPMPGLVLSIIAREGQEIKKGESLLVLEAMKMENILKSPADGVIQKISVDIGDKVEKNQVLITF